MPSCKYGADDIVKAVENGTLDIKYVDECVMRLLNLVESTSAGEKGKEFNIYEHNDLAKRCADESIVLLKNDGVLPINSDVKVAVVGDFAENPRYQGAGSSVVNPTVLSKFTEFAGEVIPSKNKKSTSQTAVATQIEPVKGVLDEASQYTLNIIGYEKGYDRYGKEDKKLSDQAVALAKKADVVLLFTGLDEVAEAEGLDREHIYINKNQIDLYNALIATGKKVVVVLQCGSAIELSWADNANALVYACLSGQAGAAAILDVITGKVNPSGKLAETFPVKYEDCSTANYFPGKEMSVEYREGPYIGYRYYNTTKTKVQYPFGFGLSYTKFRYSDIAVTDKGVTFNIRNAGSRDGAEIAQLYVGMKDSKIFRPAKELKGFKKVFIKAGESASVTIPFDDKTFRYFNVKTNKWEVEGGEYQIYIGASIEDIKLEDKITVAGTTKVIPYDKAQIPSYYSGKVTKVSDKEFSALLGGEIPKSTYNFYKKKRMVIDENCTVSDLRYSRGWVGRLFSWGIRFAIGFCRKFGMKTTANTLVMGMLHQPVRGIAKFGGMSRRQMEGMLLIFNGHFFKGVGVFLSKEKQPKKQKSKEAKS
jgi:beta-glucosidase